MRTSILTILVALSGCASTPQEVMQSGQRSVHEARLAPQRAAGCLARNAENYVDSVRATMRPLETGERYEVLVRNVTSSLRPLVLIAIVEPRADGASVVIYGGEHLVFPSRYNFVIALLQGC